ncbi:hypothetical protein CTA2_2600 [Colletotrichum tanaceti]|uniref:Uncharacterized protein n=1 Tax=Colletotrichum tanaceti TaxID=1306861 RepID=A0A4U6XTP4_9PEZI|nr:hypothetical protein CTA2_2600 [Colletotrichum tanaceti]TKW59248.1 hypothetical protein CTA1_1950 [Colletotrichum tanaceti]
MGKKTYEAESDSDMEDGGAKLNAPTVRVTPRVPQPPVILTPSKKQNDVAKSADAMDVDIPQTPAEKKQAAAIARAERALRRKQRREELAAPGASRISSMASTPNPDSQPASPTTNGQDKRSRRKKTDRNSTMKTDKVEENVGNKAEEKVENKIGKRVEEKAEQNPAAEAEMSGEPAIAPAPASAADAEPLPFVIDVTRSKVKFANATGASVAGDSTSNAPSSVSGVDSQHQGLNRAARRRLMQIENRRLAIKKELGLASDSDERRAEVDSLLATWTAQFDERTETRAAKKAAKKAGAIAKGKLLTGRNANNYEKQKQIKKQKQKEALRARQQRS